MSENHTAEPWKAELMPYKQSVYGPKGIVAEVIQNDLSKEEVQANTRFIVDAVNSHARLTAQVKELREALGKFMSWLDDGTLVRDIKRDGEPDWAMKMMTFVNDLNKAAVALKEPTDG